MRLTVLDKESFTNICKSTKIRGEVDYDFIYKVYLASCDIMQRANESATIFEQFGALSPIEHIFYTLGECVYSRQVTKPEVYEKEKETEEYISGLATMIADKTLALYFLQYREPKFGNKYLPYISTMEAYLNYFLNTLTSMSKKDPRTTLLVDLLKKSVKLADTAITLLSEGHETEAFSNWRTLHECECTLILLERYGDPLIDSYNRHMEYGIAYRHGYPQEKCDEIFVEIKEKMKEHNYKSKDIKKVIEYGWLFDIPDFNEAPENTYRLNFRDGVEKLAGLSRYAKRYELSSEIVHSTPLLIYSDDQYFFYLTLLSVYESFFRLEEVFTKVAVGRLPNLVIEAYNNFKNVYYPQLVTYYQQQSYLFGQWSKRKHEKID